MKANGIFNRITLAVFILTFVICALPLSGTETLDESKQLKSVPADALGIWHIQSVPKTVSDVQNSIIYKTLISFLKSGRLKELRKNNEKEFGLIENLLTTIPRELPKAFKSELTLAFLNYDIQKDVPTAVIIADADEKMFEEFIEKTLFPAMVELGAPAFEIDTAGKIKRIGPPNAAMGLFYEMDEERMLLTPFPDSFESVKNVKEAASDSPLLKATFEKHITSPDSLIFVNLRKLIALFTRDEELIPEYLNMLGISSIASAGYSSKMLENGGITEFTVYAPEGLKGALALFKGRGAEPSVEKYVPEDYSFFVKISAGNFHQFYKDLVALLEQNEQLIEDFDYVLREINEEFGISVENDILANLGGEIAFAAKAPKVVGIPEMAAFIEVKDKEKIWKAIENLTREKNVTFITSEYKGVKIESTNIYFAQLSFAFVDTYLVAADGPAVIRDIIDARADGKSLLTRKDYQTVFAKLPTKGFMTCYLDTKEALNSLVPLANMGMRRMALVSDALLTLQANMQETPGFGFAFMADDRSVHVRSFCGLGTAESTLPVIGGIALTAWGVDKAQRLKAQPLSNIKQLCLAAKQYALDNDEKFPEKFSLLYTDYCTSMRVFQHPMSNTERLKNEEDIDKLCDYEIVKGLTESADSDTILLYEKEQFVEGGRIVGFVDGSARWMQEKDFQKALKEQAENRKKQESKNEDDGE